MAFAKFFAPMNMVTDEKYGSEYFMKMVFLFSQMFSISLTASTEGFFFPFLCLMHCLSPP